MTGRCTADTCACLRWPDDARANCIHWEPEMPITTQDGNEIAPATSDGDVRRLMADYRAAAQRLGYDTILSALVDLQLLREGRSLTTTPQTEFVALVNELRADEADCVTICSDNPDGPPNAVVEVFGAWTDFQDRRFTGGTVLECLRAAAAAKRTDAAMEAKAP